MKKAMTSFAALLLSLALLAGCMNGTVSPPLPPSAEVDQGQPEIQAPPETEEDAAAPSLAPAETYSVETEELYTDNDGERIYGVLYRPVDVEGPLPTVVFSHGYGGDHGVGAPYAEELAGRGMLVYCFDFRGGVPGNRSDGSPLEMTVFTEQSDLEAVLTMLRSRTEVDRERIFLMGTSQGGMVSAMIGAAHPSDIRGMILLYPAFCIPGDARAHYGGGEEIPNRVSFFSWMSVGRPYVEAVLDYDIYDVIPAYTRDVLLLHGDRDGIVDLSYSRQAVEAYPSAQLEVISGAGHGFSGERFDLAMEYIVEYINGHLNDEEL